MYRFIKLDKETHKHGQNTYTIYESENKKNHTTKSQKLQKMRVCTIFNSRLNHEVHIYNAGGKEKHNMNKYNQERNTSVQINSNIDNYKGQNTSPAKGSANTCIIEDTQTSPEDLRELHVSEGCRGKEVSKCRMKDEKENKKRNKWLAYVQNRAEAKDYDPMMLITAT